MKWHRRPDLGETVEDDRNDKVSEIHDCIYSLCEY